MRPVRSLLGTTEGVRFGFVRRVLFGCAICVWLAGGLDSIAAARRVEIEPARTADQWTVTVAPEPFSHPVERGLSQAAANVVGWFDFDVVVPVDGWWTVGSTPPLPPEITVVFDPPSPSRREPARGVLHASDWFWLTAGSHRLRIVDDRIRVSIPALRSLALVSPDPIFTVFRIDRDRERRVFAAGRCGPLGLVVGSDDPDSRLTVTFRRGDTEERRQIAVGVTPRPRRIDLDLPCDRPGDVSVTIATSTREPGEAAVETTWTYAVFDTAVVEPSFREGEVVAEIDLVSRAPDYDFAGTRVTVGPAGSYRETDTAGVRWPGHIRDPNARGWFAYRIGSLTPGRPYLMEIDYPDDADRVFLTAYRDGGPSANTPNEARYAVSVGTETGGSWPLGGRIATRRMIVWPSGTDARVIVFNYHPGRPAAVSRIRFRALEIVDAPASARRAGRDGIVWYEEGSAFRNLVGLGGDPSAVHASVDRYLRLARTSGASTIIPTVLIYGSQLYPSRYNLAFNDQTSDLTAALLLGAQHYGLKVYPEVHPRADELLWTADRPEAVARRLLTSRAGRSNLLDDEGRRRAPPYHDPLDPEVRRWFREVVRELAEHGRDYPAFAGVSVRTSVWANGAFANFVSLDWGYDRETVRLFFEETGLEPPRGFESVEDGPEGAERRRTLLLAHLREPWIAWRCRKIAELYTDLVAVLKAVRPDLELVADVSLMAIGKPDPGLERLREAGVDLALLSSIPGLRVLDGRFTFGAASPDVAARLAIGERIFSAGSLGYSDRVSTLIGMQYHELPGEGWPSTSMGFPKPPVEPWISAAVEPPPPYDRARFVRLIAEHDVFAIGTGGNGYVFSGPELRDLFTEFECLPKEPFERFATESPQITVRTRGRSGYVVNVSAVPVTVRLSFRRPSTISLVKTGEVIGRDETTARMVLEPYSIRVFETDEADVLSSAGVVPSGSR